MESFVHLRKGTTPRRMHADLLTHLSHHIAMEGPRGVEEQQGVTGGRGVDDDELMSSAEHDLGELLEHSDLFGARRQEILREIRAPRIIELGALARHHAVSILLRGLDRINAGHAKVRQGIDKNIGEVSRGVCRCQVHSVAA